jgi:hypothetical protein
MMKIFSIILLMFFSTNGFCYLHNQTANGVNVHWPSTSSLIDVYVNSQNRLTLNEASVQAIAQASAVQWNGKSAISIRKNSTTGKNQAGVNEIYFSSDPVFFGGSAVKGVTQVSYRQDNGSILEAHILIDDTLSIFSTTITDLNYLGNVFTHELGHLLGLGHGQVLGSTMFYEMSYGQSELADDDKAGIFSTYPVAGANKYSIGGQVIGGKNSIPVFGAHVQAISTQTGKVIAASVSDTAGRFSIDGLPTGDQYFLYTKPLVQIGLPTYYANMKSDFCDGGKSYRGSFFESCGASGEGYPQAVSINNSGVNVGAVSIRCSLDVPPEYIQQKGALAPGYNLSMLQNGKIGNAFVGYFSSQDITLADTNPTLFKPDVFKINLSGITDWTTYTTNPYLEIKIANQMLFSPFQLALDVTRSGVPTRYASGAAASDGFMSLDVVARLPINQNLSNLSDNIFTVQITPTKNIINISGYFPSQINFQDPMYMYLLTASVVTTNNAGITYTPVSFRNYQVTDNLRCPDAVNTYSITAFNTTTGSSSNGTNQKKPFICGSVDMKNGSDGSGPGGFLVGLTLCYVMAHFCSQIRQRL